MKQDIDTIVSKAVEYLKVFASIDKTTQVKLPRAMKIMLAKEHLEVATEHFMKHSSSLYNRDPETIEEFSNKLMELLDKYGLLDIAPANNNGYVNWCPYCRD